ncbi:GNAT family N-acetyltransferase [Bacillus massiliigorillae]|uniref:GNAT family N-acetyltransferase n=1 Tax=Bacillus massiliigorillae TaxID=1243664 RepID=UPI0003A14B97|nr:GNAT family N-acetyltransferase [Bacillus massiliigorillae]
MYQIISFKEKQKWNDALSRFHKSDLYYYHGYCSLSYLMGDGEPYLFFFEDDNECLVCYPYIKRRIELPFMNDDMLKEDVFDIITPNGFGGPLTQNISEKTIGKFRRDFEEHCQKENIISEFIRFHPIIQNHHYLEECLEVIYDRETVYIDLTKSEEEIFNNYHKNHKRNIHKAISNNFEFRVLAKDEAMLLIKDFYILYKETMDKVGATPYYYYSIEYLTSFLLDLDKHCRIAAVFDEGKLISAALCMFNEEYIHYHLGCSKKEYLHLGINPFLFHHLALWSKKVGCRALHLGGGHIGRDSLFQFKHRFNDEGTLDFYVGRKIHNISKYNLLVRNWEKYYSQDASSGFFPLYRGNPQKVVSKVHD